MPDLFSSPVNQASARHALSVLRCFAEGPPERGIEEIACNAGTDPDGVREALAALCEGGFLEHTAGDRYRLGQMLVVLGRRTEEATGLSGAEIPLKQLTARTGESSSMAVLAGCHALVLLLAPSPQRLRVEHGVGSHLPLHASAMGKVLLAFADAGPDVAIAQLGELERFTSRTVTSPAALADELQLTRERGWAVNFEERYDGVVGVAAPVAVPGRGVVAAVGVQGPAARLAHPDDPALTRLVERTARRVADSLATPARPVDVQERS